MKARVSRLIANGDAHYVVAHGSVKFDEIGPAREHAERTGQRLFERADGVCYIVGDPEGKSDLTELTVT